MTPAQGENSGEMTIVKLLVDIGMAKSNAKRLIESGGERVME